MSRRGTSNGSSAVVRILCVRVHQFCDLRSQNWCPPRVESTQLPNLVQLQNETSQHWVTPDTTRVLETLKRFSRPEYVHALVDRVNEPAEQGPILNVF